MLRRNSLIILFALIFLSQINFAQSFSKEEKEILEIKDKRDYTKTEYLLDKYLTVNSYPTSLQFEYAFMNLNDSVYTKLLIDKYYKSNDNSKIRIINILPYFKNLLSEEFLLKELKNGNSAEGPNTSIIHGLSLIGGENALKEINKLPLTSKNLQDYYIRDFYVSALKNFAIRKIGNEESFKIAFDLLHTQPFNHYKVTDFIYSLNRLGNKNFISQYVKYLYNYIFYGDSITRMWSNSALGKLNDNTYIDYFINSYNSPSDWRIRVNVLNAIGNSDKAGSDFQTDKVLDLLLNASETDKSVHCQIVAIQNIAKLFTGIDTKGDIAKKIYERLCSIQKQNAAYDWQIKAEAIKTLAAIFKDEFMQELLARYSESDNYYLKAEIIRSFSNCTDPMIYKTIRDTISAGVNRYNALYPDKSGEMITNQDFAKIYRAFVDLLTNLDDKLDEENRNIVRLIYSEFMTSKDLHMVAVCLDALQDSLYLQYRKETEQIIMFDFNELKLPQDYDVMMIYIPAIGRMKIHAADQQLKKYLKSENKDIARVSAQALNEIHNSLNIRTGKDYLKEIPEPKYITDFDWKFIDNLNDKKIAVIKTSQGDIKIELRPDVAPFTVQSFVKLGEKGFYNGTAFHRVVPNFVIQGGDPTGTGEGSPKYTIRSEFSPLPYEEYTVGMASAGKDTEGSQFFITHSPQPHLDGRYTVFGKVLEGFDVVDKIQVGDVIETITFSN